MIAYDQLNKWKFVHIEQKNKNGSFLWITAVLDINMRIQL